MIRAWIFPAKPRKVQSEEQEYVNLLMKIAANYLLLQCIRWFLYTFRAFIQDLFLPFCLAGKTAGKNVITPFWAVGKNGVCFSCCSSGRRPDYIASPSVYSPYWWETFSRMPLSRIEAREGLSLDEIEVKAAYGSFWGLRGAEACLPKGNLLP